MLKTINLNQLRSDINIRDIYQEMIWTADGYIHMEMNKGKFDTNKIISDFERLIFMWELVYRKG